jgi:hypothetical protein
MRSDGGLALLSTLALSVRVEQPAQSLPPPSGRFPKTTACMGLENSPRKSLPTVTRARREEERPDKTG